MRNGKRGRYTLEFKYEAVPAGGVGLERSGGSPQSGVIEQTLSNWVKAHRGGEVERGQRQDGRDAGANGVQSLAGGVGASDDGARHPGKSNGKLRKRPEVKYAFIERHRPLWPISVQCRVLGVSISGFHQHLARRKLRRRHLSGAALLVHIRAAYAEHRGPYGWPRIWRELVKRGIRVGK
jgi:putative transposase